MSLYNWSIASLLLFFSMALGAQQNQYIQAGDSDPEARALLTAMSEKLDNWGTMQLTFDFEYSMPDGQKIKEKGKIIQSGQKYRIEMGDQLVLSDGKYQWLFLKSRNELQINDLDEAASQMTPTYFFNFHHNEDFVYAITNHSKSSSGVIISRVDFKPVDDFVEYAKIGLDIDEKTKLPVALLVLLKEGGKYIFSSLTFKKWKGETTGLFSFNAAQYPGIYIEDLRLD